MNDDERKQREVAEQLRDRASDATSDETLEDLEEGQKTGGGSNERDDVPSPDAKPSGDRQQRDDAGPM